MLPIANWYLPCFPSSLFKKLRKLFSQIHARASLGARTHLHCFLGISVIRKATSLWKYSQCCYVDIGRYEWKPPYVLELFIADLSTPPLHSMFCSCGNQVQQLHYVNNTFDVWPHHCLLMASLPSTGSGLIPQTLSSSKNKHPFVEAMPQYRDLCKEILNTYIVIIIFVGRHLETFAAAQQHAMAWAQTRNWIPGNQEKCKCC